MYKKKIIPILRKFFPKIDEEGLLPKPFFRGLYYSFDIKADKAVLGRKNYSQYSPLRQMHKH